jgi:predicted RNase H-like HicB family nuclease
LTYGNFEVSLYRPCSGQSEDNIKPAQEIEYTVQIWKEGNQFIAHARPLDVMSSGKTPDEARKALDEAIHLFLVTAADMANLEEILQNSGYEYAGGNQRENEQGF